MTQTGLDVISPVDLAEFKRVLRLVRLPLCLTDPTQPDDPIVFANDAFLELTGYREAEVLGRNWRLLQGPETTADSIEQVRAAIAESKVASVRIVNYRKDGSRFDNALQIGPIVDAHGRTVLFLHSHFDISRDRVAQERDARLMAQEQRHRLRNIVKVMEVSVRLTARESNSVEELAERVVGRLHALGEAHFKTFDPDHAERWTLHGLIAQVVGAYAPRGAAQCELRGEDAPLPDNLVSVMTLALHELAINAVKHGALSAPDGRVQVDSGRDADSGDVAMMWVEHGGPEVRRGEHVGGSAIIEQLLGRMGGALEFDWRPSGLAARLTFPARDLPQA